MLMPATDGAFPLGLTRRAGGQPNLRERIVREPAPGADAAGTAIRRHMRGVLQGLPRAAATRPHFFETGPGIAGALHQAKGRTP